MQLFLCKERKMLKMQIKILHVKRKKVIIRFSNVYLENDKEIQNGIFG